jgi:hypothetical protein
MSKYEAVWKARYEEKPNSAFFDTQELADRHANDMNAWGFESRSHDLNGNISKRFSLNIESSTQVESDVKFHVIRMDDIKEGNFPQPSVGWKRLTCTSPPTPNYFNYADEAEKFIQNEYGSSAYMWITKSKNGECVAYFNRTNRSWTIL